MAKETRTKSGQEVRTSGSGLFKETSIGEHEKNLDCFFSLDAWHISEDQGQQMISVKGQRAHISGSADHTVYHNSSTLLPPLHSSHRLSNKTVYRHRGQES